MTGPMGRSFFFVVMLGPKPIGLGQRMIKDFTSPT
jgi:hypothetical protein